jgi:hypothetical protein
MAFSLKDLELLKIKRIADDTKQRQEHFLKQSAEKLKTKVLEGVNRYLQYEEKGPLEMSLSSFDNNLPTSGNKILPFVLDYLKQEFPDFCFSIDSGYEHVESYGPREPAYDQPYTNVLITWQGQ